MQRILAASLLMLFLVSFFSVISQASGNSFSTPVKLGAGSNPNVQSLGNHVYVAWTDKNQGIIFRFSSDGGHSWSPTMKLGNGNQYPIMSASGNKVYIVW